MIFIDSASWILDCAPSSALNRNSRKGYTGLVELKAFPCSPCCAAILRSQNEDLAEPALTERHALEPHGLNNRLHATDQTSATSGESHFNELHDSNVGSKQKRKGNVLYRTATRHMLGVL